MTLPEADAPDRDDDDLPEDDGPACVMVFNASDPSGAGGLGADAVTIASVGGHALTVATGAYARDSARIFEYFALDEEAVAEQARAVLEDMQVDVVKVGFLGTPENVSAVAEITADYEEAPVIAYMPDLSWWREDEIEAYLDAFRELLLPQATVLVGNHSTLWRWLLPDWTHQRSPTPRDIAKAAGEMGVPYTLVTGVPLPEQFVENVLASPQTVLSTAKFELFDAVFSGAGDTLSAALAALVAHGNDLAEATAEALHYLDRSLDAGFRPGMGNVLPDRMFWAQPETEEESETDEAAQDPGKRALEGFVMPPHDTQH
ncbi:bifunctional hydroxymethylpyrimidine kinase/phosphomethylpyrimidine kinase [Xylophilus sp. ASV27]|uniref:bifunctional hydroxymethylpyrimidine kinase/phosphomethylpyrimidine kinase n=1 Tax=Xylophilus sp. ASV27 TaxID=2795129 RepID=UPI0018EC4D74|nr:bifunctional hydroxymethylpyrimidine kinase/phosphomethylpyrimidine kinase [Xylophilus sp. ASV27]